MAGSQQPNTAAKSGNADNLDLADDAMIRRSSTTSNNNTPNAAPRPRSRSGGSGSGSGTPTRHRSSEDNIKNDDGVAGRGSHERVATSRPRTNSMHEMWAQTSDPPSRRSSAGQTSAGRPPAAAPANRRSSKFVYVLHGVMRFLKDVMTFLIRGGLSALMFLMDQALSAVLVVTNFIPGGIYIQRTLRAMMWAFQVLIWVVYTSFEMTLYLPTSFLIVYILVLAAVYSYLPESGQSVLSFIFWLGHGFLHFVKDVVYGYSGYDRNKVGLASR